MFYVQTNLYPNIIRLSLSCLNIGELPGGIGQKRNNDWEVRRVWATYSKLLCHREDPENILSIMHK